MEEGAVIIYVLQGSTGEYSDRTDWIVRAYLDKAKADAACTKANDEARKYHKEMEAVGYDDWAARERAEKEVAERVLTVDPNAQFDYTGTTYWVEECALV